MLNDVKKLEESMTLDQTKRLKEALGDDLYKLLDIIFDSDSEEEVKAKIGNFVSAAKTKPFKIVKARKVLNEDQKEIIMKFLER